MDDKLKLSQAEYRHIFNQVGQQLLDRMRELIAGDVQYSSGAYYELCNMTFISKFTQLGNDVVRFNSVQFGSIRFNSVRFRSIRGSCEESWRFSEEIGSLWQSLGCDLTDLNDLPMTSTGSIESIDRLF